MTASAASDVEQCGLDQLFNVQIILHFKIIRVCCLCCCSLHVLSAHIRRSAEDGRGQVRAAAAQSVTVSQELRRYEMSRQDQVVTQEANV